MNDVIMAHFIFNSFWSQMKLSNPYIVHDEKLPQVLQTYSPLV